MKHCLFVQWKKPTDASRYVIDGTPYEYSGTEEQDKIMKILANVPKYKEICKNKNRKDLSPSFRCSYSTIEKSLLYFVEGNFEDVDSAGRKMVYIFMTHENAPLKIVELLKDYSSKLGVTPHNEDLEEIKKQTFKKEKNNLIHSLIWTTIVIITTFLLLSMLQSILNKPSTTNGTQNSTKM